MNPSSTPKHRPILVTWLSIGVLILAALQLLRFLAALRLPDLGYSVPTWYLGVRNGLWFVLLLGIGLSLFSGRRWALRGVQVGTLLLFLWYWIDRLLLVQSNYIRQTSALSALLSITSIALFFWILSRSQVKTFFKE
jgi:hypothetical protein